MFFSRLFVFLRPVIKELNCIHMKTDKLTLLFLMLFLALSFASCVTQKHVRYLQDMPTEGMPINEALEATVAPYDELRIYVLSNTGGKDDELVKPFNSLQHAGNNLGGGGYYLGYLVDGDGFIDFPVLGRIQVGGLTRGQVQDSIAAQLVRNGHLKDPLVIARIMNFKVYFLTSSGGKVLSINNERCTFLEAIAMAGGLDWYTRRDRIGVMREVNGKRVVHYLDPRSTAVFDDDFFLLQQTDIIFTEERSYKFFSSNLSTILGLISSAVSVFAIYKMIRSEISHN